MVGVFVRLKLQLQANALRRSPGAAVLYVVGWLASLGLGSLLPVLAWIATREGTESDVAQVMTLYLVALPAVWVLWIVGPLVAGGGGDPMIDPARFELLPLTYGQQVRGLLAAAMVGPAALGTLLVGLTPLAGPGVNVLSGVLIVVAAVVFVMLCAATSRMAAAALVAAMNSRRGRDLAILAGVAVVALAYAAGPITAALVGTASQQSFQSDVNLVALIPPGAAGKAAIEATQGTWLLSLGLLAYAALWVAVLLWLWARVLRRRVVRGGGRSARESTVAVGAGSFDLIPRWLEWLVPAGPLGGSAAKQWRYAFFRSPESVKELLIAIGISLFLGYQLCTGFFPDVMAPLAAPLVATWALVQTNGNAFGVDGGSLPQYVLTGARMPRVLTGQFLANAAVAVPAAVALAVVVSLQEPEYGDLWLSLALLVVAVPAVLGLTAVLSVRFPVRLGAGRQRSGSAILMATLAQFVTIVVVLVVVGVLGEALGSLTGQDWLGVVVGLAVSLAIAVAGLSWADRSFRHDPTRLLVLLGSDRTE